jgi:Spy/CpxP family protein refolding chaperone
MKLSWKKFGVSIVVAGALLIAASVVFSQGPPRGDGFRGGPGAGDGLGPFGRDLNLTDNQKAQIKKIQDSFREADKALFDQLKTLRESEPNPMSDAFDEAAVRSAAEAKAKIQIELDVSRAKMMSQIASILTSEQKAQLAARRKQFERQGHPPPPDRP